MVKLGLNLNIMKNILDFYTIQSSATFLEALKQININTKGFLVVNDTDSKVVGVLTEGDIRRAFIFGACKSDAINDYVTREFTSLNEGKDIYDAIDLFQNNDIKFLPILNQSNELVNIITKRQLHALLLQDNHVDINYDFHALEDSYVDYEIFHRPWGFYKTTFLNDYFQSKVISIMPGQRLSLQSHRHREEHWIVVHGTGIVRIEESNIKVRRGSSVFVPMGAKHRLSNTSTSENLIIAEVQIGDYFGEDDIVRYEDDYDRT